MTKENVPVKWLKNGMELKMSDKIEFVTDGFKQKLILHNVTLDDKAEYTCVCGDVSTKATLNVEGMLLFFDAKLNLIDLESIYLFKKFQI